ncbi:MAG TPA: 30S ribosomal protein S8 [Firmicutes bacterium]|nr:30S ribosomal protein S8 [Bacillota bacterium]
MVMTDPIGDMLTRIRNASSVRHHSVDVPASRLKLEIARLLKDEGFIRDVEVLTEDGKRTIRIFLKYGPQKEAVISGIKRISRPGLRVYARKEEVPKVLGGLGCAILSTPEGLLTDKQARQKGIGGEVLCYIW